MDSPRAVITDANIWIDLNRGGITAEAFKLDLVFKTPDLVAHEILSPSAASLKRSGLHVVELPGTRVLEIIQLARKYPRPSRPDLSALVLAAAEGAILLTGDKALRAAGEEEGIEVRGLLWLLDEMVKSQVLTGGKAIAALQQMLENGSRLPQSDCERCIQAWRTATR
jgi:predicted nucleic acid-binding protein